MFPKAKIVVFPIRINVDYCRNMEILIEISYQYFPNTIMKKIIYANGVKIMHKNATQVFTELITDFINTQLKGKKKALIFFQGFPSSFYKALLKADIKRFADSAVGTESGYIDYSQIDPSKLLQNYLGCQGLSWGYYEELIAITDILNDLTIFNGEVIVVKNNLFDIYYPIDIPVEIIAASQIFETDSVNNGDSKLQNYYSDFKIVNDTGFYSYVNKHYEIDTNKDIKEINFYSKNITSIATTTLPEIFISTLDLEAIKLELQKGNLSDTCYLVNKLDAQPMKDIQSLNTLGSRYNVIFKSKNISRDIEDGKKLKHMSDFRKYWGKDANYWDLKIYSDPSLSSDTIDISQGSLISDIINQCENAMSPPKNYSDVIITAPTGAGKSLFFQVPGIYLHNRYNALTLVITPLIALMKDQVLELQLKRIDFSTYINSEISFEERQSRLDGIKTGRYSIVYLSPELLLANDIRNIIGDRNLALVVVDEAHLVTSWGRDFRVDYWFLGDYMEKIRRVHYYQPKNTDALHFPILCLTATAVFSGRDDVVGDLQNSLHLNCSAEHLYVGYVRRDNISFNIRQTSKKRNTKKEDKVNRTCQRIQQFCEEKNKAIVYFPYVSQIEDVHKEICSHYPQWKKYVEQYSGSMDKFEKNDAYHNFRDNRVSTMLATKAFGMGINIPDVDIVYHFAPTGTLADYVQEIGRAARKLDKGYAMTDYMPNDMNYARTLWGLSGLRHYQIKAMMKKLYSLYSAQKHRNLLISPDVFSYLFDARSVDGKVKSGLMLLSADLLEKYHFRVITLRPKSIFSKHYIHVPKEVEDEFLNEFNKYCVLMNDDKPRIIPGQGNRSEVTVYNANKIYEIDLSEVWENEFDDLTFAKFKFHFFSGDLFSFGPDKITPRMKLVIHYDNDYEIIKEEMLKVVAAVQKTVTTIHHVYGGREFTFEDFRKTFVENYHKKMRREYITMLLDLFCYEGVYFEEIPVEQWKFINKTKSQGENELYNENKYCIRTQKYNFIEQNLKRYLVQCQPNTIDGNTFSTYLKIPKGNGKYSEYQLLASLLELFNLATYEVVGGRNPQIFVRINDPLKLKRIAESDREYRNGLLVDIGEKHKRAAQIVDRFLNIEMNDADRWSLIQSYFLGYDEEVDSILGIKG